MNDPVEEQWLPPTFCNDGLEFYNIVLHTRARNVDLTIIYTPENSSNMY